jgi:hypothetical protein
MKPAAKARLAATIDPLGSLVRAQSGIVGVRLRNTGRGTSGQVTAAIELPKGVTPQGASGRKGASVGVAATPVGTADGWSCRMETRAAHCTRDGLAAGQSTALFLRVQVAPDAPAGAGPAVRVKAGGLSVTARSTAEVRASGASARFAADGRLVTRAIGNTLLTCPKKTPGCAAAATRTPGRRDNDLWHMVALDHDGDPATANSSSARLALPRGSRLVWAGLYWSATGDTDRRIKLRGPGAGAYTTVRSTEVTRRKLPIGPGYQAFADVTRLVRGHAQGRWWVADARLRAGISRHAGWSLVVVAADPHQPYGQAAVLDTATVVSGAKGTGAKGTGAKGAAGKGAGGPGPGGTSLDVVLGGLSASAAPARLDLVTWDGDADLKGDMVTLGGRALRPDGGDRDPHNAFDSSVFDSPAGKSTGPAGKSTGPAGKSAGPAGKSAGPTGAMRAGPTGAKRADSGSASREGTDTFGVDVDTFHPILGHHPVLRLVTRKDVLFFGVAVVCAPART